ncbi:MAG: phosphatidylserine decarboxylase family protein [Bacteroidetes bacterium]|nr:MAG: phosphatidylserine decarboxylase family protein [Bacteroidota bacterium]
MKLGLHKEGNNVIPIFFIIIAVVLYGLHFFIPFEGIGMYALIILDLSGLIFFGLVVYFFRYPIFIVQKNHNQFLSPADGEIVVVEKVMETEYYNEERLQVSIFMSPFNTHMNRYPIDGKISYFKYHPGKFLVAWHPKSSTLNERATFVLENETTSVLLRQIAGAVARRIRWYNNEGDEIEQGDQLGFIKFGSRVDLFLPLSAEVNVELNQQVRAGKTVIASLK